MTIPYHANLNRAGSHYSNLYYGASLPALCDYAEKHNCYLGSNSAGHNAFFVRKDSIDCSIIPLIAKSLLNVNIEKVGIQMEI